MGPAGRRYRSSGAEHRQTRTQTTKCAARRSVSSNGAAARHAAANAGSATLSAQWRHLGGMGGLRTPPRIVKCKSFALSVTQKAVCTLVIMVDNTNLVQSTSITAMVTVCNVLSDDMDVLHNCPSRIAITNSEK